MIRRTLVAASLLGAALVAAAPVPATGQETPGDAGARLTLLDQPIAVAPDGDFTVLLEIDDAPSATQIAVDIYDAVQPNEVVGAQPEGGSEATFGPIDLPPARGTAARQTGFAIQLHPSDEPNPDPAWGWEIDEPGVYPVRVRLRDDDGNVLQVLMTSLIRLPEADQEVPQTNAALLVGVHRGPPEDPEARSTADRADRELLDDLEPVLDALGDRPTLPATFSITPDTLARIAADEGATADLAQLRTELASDDRSLLDAPYVDVDAASLVSADLADNLALQRDVGRRTLSDLLEPPEVGTWQLRNRIDPDTLAELRTRGITRTLLPADALGGGAGVLAPVDLPSGGATTRAVAVSPSYALGLDPVEDPVLAAHRLLGRLASTGPGPTGSPSVVIPVDPALASPASLQIVSDALLLGTPFFTATDLGSVLDAQPAPAGAVMTTPSLPELGTYPVTYRQAQGSLDSYQSMVGGRNELIDPYNLTLAVSASQDLPLEQRRNDAASVTESLQVPFTSIEVPAKDKVTLGADNAKFPLPVDSSLDYPVKVVIELEANDRVQFPQNRIEQVLDPGSTVVDIPVETRAAGDTPVRITVRSPDDGVILAESQYTIRSTAVSGVGLVLTGGAALFLAVWWGRHWRRTRAERRAADAVTSEL
ncbi:MAG TPA: DUF6049 family protein [Acidimicrobiales bacterium]|nr:DUF6049 family protein [Acidimicrobiales bacterium]